MMDKNDRLSYMNHPLDSNANADIAEEEDDGRINSSGSAKDGAAAGLPTNTNVPPMLMNRSIMQDPGADSGRRVVTV